MLYIVKYFFKLILAYLIITVVTQAVFDNLQAQSIDISTYSCLDITLLSLSTSFDHLSKLQWGSLRTVEMSLWIFNNKIHYLLLVLVVLVLYYHYKDSTLKSPSIPRMPRKDPEEYEEQKKTLTQQKVEELVNSQKYREYVRKRQWNEGEGEQEETDGDWDRAQEEIYDQ